MLTAEEFELLKSHQYCDNVSCPQHNKTGLSNIKINSRSKGQVYCNICGNRWVVTKGTIFFGLKTPLDKVINTLLLLVRGMGLRNASCQAEVTVDSILYWLVKAATFSNEFTIYMQQEMHLDQVQIDEFWSFIRKKNKTLQTKRESYQN